MIAQKWLRQGPWGKRLVVMLAVFALVLLPLPVRAQDKGGNHNDEGGSQVNGFSGLNAQQRATLYSIARDSWRFYQDDIDPHTNLPMDNLTFAGGSPTPTGYGRYTSSANIGVYLWAVVAANDLGLVKRPDARRLIEATLNAVSTLQRYKGFLFQWYDTTNGHRIRNPSDIDCATEPTPVKDNCYFVSAVDNGWYASGLIVVREAMPELKHLVDSLMAPMDFSIFYDNGPETECNVYYNPNNPKDPNNYQPTGQQYGGYYAYQGPAGYHNGALYSDPRISMLIGMGLHQMPGNVWWRSWRVLPPKAPYDNCQASDPDFSWQGQWPVDGFWRDYRDPQSGRVFHVWEGHYKYTPDPSLTFLPTFAGGMFEAEMVNQVVPETSWAPNAWGLADLRDAQVQIRYAKEVLHYPVWGMSPSSTADDTGGYGGFGVAGRVFPYFGGGADANHPNKRLAQCSDCATEDVVSPHASFITLDVVPQQAFDNIQALRTLYPDVYGHDGFFDAVNPTTHQVGHRILVLDQSMIMAALDNALQNRAMQQHFARDPVAQVVHPYLSMECMSLASGNGNSGEGENSGGNAGGECNSGGD